MKLTTIGLAFKFWNTCFLNRTIAYQRRRLPRTPRKINPAILCDWCHEDNGIIFDYKEYVFKSDRVIKSGVICRSCHAKIESAYLKGQRGEIKSKSLSLIATFDNMLDDCTKKGTCDILAAHHDLLKDDPDRLTTKTLLGLVCNNSKDKSYLDKWEVLKQQQEANKVSFKNKVLNHDY